MMRHYPKSMLPHQRMGLWCKSILSSSNLWSVLQAERSFARKVKNKRFDKSRASKFGSRPRTKLQAGDHAKNCTARSLRDTVPLALEGVRLDSALEFSNPKISTKSIVLLASKKNKLTMEKQTKDQSENRNRSERDDLKHLLADLLDKKPKLNKSDSVEYVRTSPIFKLMTHSAEHRNSLRCKSFQTQLEIPSFFQYPLGKYHHRNINITRRTTIFPVESQFEKRTKQALKQKLCLLLQDNKDLKDDVD